MTEGDDAVLSRAGIAYKEGTDETWKRFLVLLLFATLVPISLIPLGQFYNGNAQSIVLILGVMNFFGGTAHVGASAYFYTDPVQFQFFRSRPIRFFILPAALVILTALVYQWSSPSVQASVLLLYFIWQTYHYQKQNYGIFCFVSAGTKTSRPNLWENICIELGVMAGILGLINVMQLFDNTPLANYSFLVYTAGLYIIYSLPVFLFLAFATNPDLRRCWTRGLALVMGTFFYLPTFLFSDVKSAIFGYALAHGIQYLVFMSFVSGSSANKNPAKQVTTLFACLFAGGLLLTLMADRGLWGKWGPGVFGAYLGLVMADFLLDAGVWRLREKFQGDYIRSRMGFIFSK